MNLGLSFRTQCIKLKRKKKKKEFRVYQKSYSKIMIFILMIKLVSFSLIKAFKACNYIIEKMKQKRKSPFEETKN